MIPRHRTQGGQPEDDPYFDAATATHRQQSHLQVCEGRVIMVQARKPLIFV